MEEYPDQIFREDNIDFKKFLLKVLFNWYWFAISLGISMSIAYLYNRYNEPIYRVEASIIVRDDEKSKGLTGAENIIQGLEMFRSRKNVQNEMTILKSYSLANRTLNELEDFKITYIIIGRRGIKEAKLYNRSPFVVHLDSSLHQRSGLPVNLTILSDKKFHLQINENENIDTVLQFGQKFTSDNFSFTVVLRNPEQFRMEYWLSNTFKFIINDINQLTNFYKNKLVISINDKKGSVLFLSGEGFVPQQEVDYLNKLSEVYIRSGLEEKNQTAENTIKFIDKQLTEILDSLKMAEESLQDFRLRNRLIDMSSESELITDNISKFQTEKSLLIINENYYKYLNDYLTNKTSYDDIIAPSVMGIDDPLLNSLVVQLAELNREKFMLSYSATENNPSIVRINQNIQDLRYSLIENVKNQIKANNLALENVNQRIDQIEKEILKLPVTERQLINIERKFSLNNNIYTYLLEKRSESGIAKASNIPDNRILDMARVQNASKIKPKNSLNYMIALILGILAPLAIIFIVELLNNKILDKKDIISRTNAPVLGTIGHSHFESDIPVFKSPKSSLAESFRSLRTNLQYLAPEQKHKFINITSAISGEGKTFLAINLAAIIAISNKKTLLIGVDMRKPKIHRVFNLDNSIGLSSYLIGEQTYNEIIRSTEIENLYIANSGPVPPNPAELLDSKRMRDFVDQAKKEFDCILTDTPPIAVVTDALLLTKYSDVNLFLLRQNYSNKNILNLVDNLFSNKEIRNLNLIVNDVKVSGYYGYSYRYDYGYGYGYGYSYGGGYYTDDGERSSFRWLKKLLRLNS